MFIKEIKETGKYSAAFILILLLQPLFGNISTIFTSWSFTYLEAFHIIFPIGLLFWANFLGSSIFLAEQKQHSMEYVLGLPYTRIQLILLKLVPRFLSLLLFALIFIVFNFISYFNSEIPISNTAFFLILLMIFCCSLFLSASFDSVLKTSLFSWLLSFLFLLLYGTILKIISSLKYNSHVPSYYFHELQYNHLLYIFLFFLLVIGPLLFSFFFTIRRLDVRPKSSFNLRILRISAPLTMAGILIFSLIAFSNYQIKYNDYYLTNSQQLIQSNVFSLHFYNPGLRKTIKNLGETSLNNAIEINGHIYIQSTGIDSDKIIRINLSDYKHQTIYNSPRLNYFMYKYNHELLALESQWKKPDTLIIYDTQRDRLEKISFEFPKTLSRNYLTQLFGCSTINGQRYFLFICHERTTTSKTSLLGIYCLWQDGRLEKISAIQTYQAFFAHEKLIYTNENTLVIAELTANGLVILKKIPQGVFLKQAFYLRDLSPQNTHFFYGYLLGKQTTNSMSVIELDLSNLEIRSIKKTQPKELHYQQFFSSSSDHLYYIEYKATPANTQVIHKIHFLHNGNMELIKEFDYKNQNIRQCSIHKAGNGIEIKLNNESYFYLLQKNQAILFPTVFK